MVKMFSLKLQRNNILAFCFLGRLLPTKDWCVTLTLLSVCSETQSWDEKGVDTDRERHWSTPF